MRPAVNRTPSYDGGTMFDMVPNGRPATEDEPITMAHPLTERAPLVEESPRTEPVALQELPKVVMPARRAQRTARPWSSPRRDCSTRSP
jgi:hypothetical protein